MQIGMIGLGRMGGNIVRRLLRNGHTAVVYDRDRKAVDALLPVGVSGTAGLDELVSKLSRPRVIWVMLPAGDPTETVIQQLAELLERGDVIIDGGNTFWRDDIRRAKSLKQKGIEYVDVGTSGGVWGLERGYCMMIGGDKQVVKSLDPIFSALAPGAEDVPPDHEQASLASRAGRGYIHAGPSGAGHFVKMVHNGSSTASCRPMPKDLIF